MSLDAYSWSTVYNGLCDSIEDTNQMANFMNHNQSWPHWPWKHPNESGEAQMNPVEPRRAQTSQEEPSPDEPTILPSCVHPMRYTNSSTRPVKPKFYYCEALGEACRCTWKYQTVLFLFFIEPPDPHQRDIVSSYDPQWPNERAILTLSYIALGTRPDKQRVLRINGSLKITTHVVGDPILCKRGASR